MGLLIMITVITTESLRTRGLLWVAVFISLSLGIAFQGSRGLYETTEGRYAESARETMASGDLDSPILNGQPHWTKPFLTYAAIMAGIKVFGHNPWGVRAYLILAWMIFVMGVGWAGSVIWNRRAGGLSALVAATSPFLSGAANAVSTDMLLAAWVSVAVSSFFHGLYRRTSWTFVLTGLALGLGVLTKGPVALLVPFAVIIVAWPMFRRADRWYPRLLAIFTGLFLFVTVGAGWFIWKAWEHPGLMDYWLGKELGARFATDEFHRNPGFPYVLKVYLPILLVGTGAWLPIVLFKNWPWRAFKFDAIDADRVAVLPLLCGLFIPLVVFSISKSKLPLYLTVLFVPLCILLGRALDRLLDDSRLTWKSISYVAVGTIILIISTKLAVTIPEHPNDMTRMASHLSSHLAKQDEMIKLYSLGSRPLNGLEFHLQRLIVPVLAKDIASHMQEHCGDKYRNLYLMKRKEWKKLKVKFPEGAIIDAIGPYWLVIEVRCVEK